MQMTVDEYVGLAQGGAESGGEVDEFLFIENTKTRGSSTATR